MNRVGDQRQRVRGVTENKLRADDSRVERNTDGKREAEIVGRMAVPGMAVSGMILSGMAMGVRMVVMIVVVGHGARDNRCGGSLASTATIMRPRKAEYYYGNATNARHPSCAERVVEPAEPGRERG
jgi:hypothetical protein